VIIKSKLAGWRDRMDLSVSRTYPEFLMVFINWENNNGFDVVSVKPGGVWGIVGNSFWKVSKALCLGGKV